MSIPRSFSRSRKKNKYKPRRKRSRKNMRTKKTRLKKGGIKFATLNQRKRGCSSFKE